MTGILFLIGYTAIMLATTIVFSRRYENSDNFYVGNRDLKPVAAALSIAATWIWAPALFTSAEKAYTNGFAGLFWFTIPNVLCLLFFIPFAKKIRKEMPEGITLSGFIHERYHSKKARNVYLVQLSALSILSTGVQLLAGGKIMSMVTGIPFPIMTVILAAIAYSYSQISGIQASIITDDLQMALILGACALFIPWALMKPDGVNNLVNGLGGFSGEFKHVFSSKGLEVFLGFGLPTAIGLIAGPFGDQCFWQRAFCTEEKKIGKAFGLGALFFAIAPISMGILGFIAAGAGFVPSSTGTVNFELITSMFPRWTVAPFLFMLICGLLSTVDSNLCAFSSLVNDLCMKKTDRKAARLSMLALSVAGIAIANIPGLTVTQLFLFYGTLRATTLLPTVLTLLNVKLTGSGVTAGVITALCCGLPVFAYGNIMNISVYKPVGSLLTVLSAGFISILVSRVELSIEKAAHP